MSGVRGMKEATRKAGRVREAGFADIVERLNLELAVSDFPDDSSANGLQFQGRGKVRKVAVSVDACLPVIEEAVRQDADMLIVHHGLIWGGGLRSVGGALKRKLSALFKADMSLYACHLPLDAHPRHGNNASILKALGARIRTPFGHYQGRTIGYWGSLPRSIPLESFRDKVDAIVGVTGGCRIAGFGGPVRNIAVVSGGGAGSAPEMEGTEIDTFLTGEPSHAAWLQAEEMGKNLIFAGHYATETFGVKALAGWIESKFGLRTDFIDHPTGM